MLCTDSIGHSWARRAGAVLIALCLLQPVARADDLERQRELFRLAYETAERGDWGIVDRLPAADRELLEQYVLWPDLRAAWLRSNLKKVPTPEVRRFLDKYGTLQPARALRYRYALHLGRGGKLERFSEIYEQFYQGRGIATLDCLALQADIAAGRHKQVPGRAVDLWLVGTSQVDECDPVFDYLGDRQLLGPVEYRKRFELAVAAREFRLARWLAKSIDEQHARIAAHWTQAQANPERFLARHDPTADSDQYREQLVYAAERLTYRDPEIALRLWRKVEKRYGFSEEQKLRTRRHIALWTARDNLPDGYRLLADLPPASRDDEVMRWRARLSVREHNWQRLLIDIDAMQTDERELEDWQYWRAIALLYAGRLDAGRGILENLSAERSYYGFLAADELGKEYAIENASLPADEAAQARLAGLPGLLRARELFLTGLEGRGRSEWEAAIRHLGAEDRKQAAVLAARWGWHSRAIATASTVEAYDDLAMRYPLPWQEQFESYASAARIDPTWAYGIARSESLFMRDARSSAGAIGLMQLLPTTGRQVARELRVPWSGAETLTDPDSNIRLGTKYLGQMAERFGGNPVVATAAYNAGPHRVTAWLPEKGSEDARAWIENIPFNETRKYVKRVLTAQAIFHWRMTGETRRIAQELRPVAAIEQTQLAAR